MSSTHTPRDRLLAVQRLQELELDEAQTLQARLEKAAAAQRQRLGVLEAGLDEDRRLEVTLMASAAGVSVEALRQLRMYLHAQGQDLLQQQEILSKAEAEADTARLSVVGSFERLSATRRLRERRVAEASVQQLRAQFKKFDDMAIVTKRNA